MPIVICLTIVALIIFAPGLLLGLLWFGIPILGMCLLVRLLLP